MSITNAILSSPRRLAVVFICIVATLLILHRSSLASISSTGALDITRPLVDKTQDAAAKTKAGVKAANAALKGAKEMVAKITDMADLPVKAPAGPIDYMAGKVTPLAKLSYADQQRMIKRLNEWDPNTQKDHWPAFSDYATEDYDPNRWEGLEWETDFFAEVGVRDVQKDSGLKPEPYLPYPDYNTPSWNAQWHGQYVACEGARGKLLNDSIEDMVLAYRAAPEEFPPSTIGSGAVLGLDHDVCFDRFNRLGPYGYGQTVSSGPSDWSRPEDRPEWSSVWWGQLQDICLLRNKERFAEDAREVTSIAPTDEMPEGHEVYTPRIHQREDKKYHSRTALLIRTWEGYQYTENDLETFRALVTELSLLSGGEYQVFLLVNVKDTKSDIYNDPKAYESTLRRVVPRELRDFSILWNEKMCKKYYPDIGDWQVYWHQFMVLQWFSKTHPEFDYVWNWETDTRYIGNHYHFLEKVANFARNMPRKNLWERNSRYYIPAYHGNYASFLADTDAAIAQARADRNATSVWGALPFNENQRPVGPEPPTDYDEDKFKWGVGEDADLITMQPIWDPLKTKWAMRNKIWNFVQGKRPHFTHKDRQDREFDDPAFADIPRRAYINTVSRFSKRMLHAMHLENRKGRTMQAEMWPATVALQHGLKAVYAPVPIWTDRKWPAWYTEAIFNANAGDAAAWSARWDSVYNHDREASFRGWSWYYASWFPRILYRRWYGWAAVDVLGQVGGDHYEDSGFMHSEFGHIGGNGRMCIPGMLLHPVKKVKQNDDGDNDFIKGSEKDLESAEKIGADVERILNGEKLS